MLRRQTITRSAFSRLVTVSMCFYAFSAMPIPQFRVLTWAESAEDECPSEKDREGAEEERVERNSERRRLKKRPHSNFGQFPELGRHHLQITSLGDPPLGVIGHQLANGICAPLLI